MQHCTRVRTCTTKVRKNSDVVLIITQVLRVLIPAGMHLLRVASPNAISILLFSLLAVFVIARIRPLRKWLLLIK